MADELKKREKQEVATSTAEQMNHSGTAFSPDVDIYASENEMVLLVDLPGVAKGDVNIQVDETNSLIIRAKNSHSEPEGSVWRQFGVGDFYRAFQLSDEHDRDKISAKLENGLLELAVPKREEFKPKKLEIKA
jgi:HSP20 family molecular chaperone IbpA